jgi:hypothetical protein
MIRTSESRYQYCDILVKSGDNSGKQGGGCFARPMAGFFDYQLLKINLRPQQACRKRLRESPTFARTWDQCVLLNRLTPAQGGFT